MAIHVQTFLERSTSALDNVMHVEKLCHPKLIKVCLTISIKMFCLKIASDKKQDDLANALSPMKGYVKKNRFVNKKLKAD